MERDEKNFRRPLDKFSGRGRILTMRGAILRGGAGADDTEPDTLPIQRNEEMRAKDFEALGEAIKDARNALIASLPEESRDTIHRVIKSMALDVAKVCASQNPKFDRARFLQSCGMGPS